VPNIVLKTAQVIHPFCAIFLAKFEILLLLRYSAILVDKLKSGKGQLAHVLLIHVKL